MPTPIRLDVTQGASLGEHWELSAALFLPAQLRQPATLCVMLPGGTYTKDYYNLVVPGRTAYSAAEYLTREGIVVVTIDHLGTGESTFPADGRRVTLETIANANAAAVRQLRSAAMSGELDASLPPLPSIRIVGFGHSLGGYLLQIQQGEHASFDAVAIAGSTCQQMNGLEDGAAPVREILPADKDGYFIMPRAQNRAHFYYPDVPQDVIDADETSLSPLPAGMMDVGVPGRTVAYAAQISCPVFLAFGQIDLSPNPSIEPSFYPNCPDLTLFRLPRSGHCHNSASTRHALWQRQAAWLTAVLVPSE